MIVIAWLVLPIAALLWQVEQIENPLRSEFFDVLLQSTVQATLSSLSSLVLGIFGALGVLKVSSSKARRVLEIFVLLPSLLPALFVIVATINLTNWVTNFPFGIVGVVLVHAAMNVGLVAVSSARLLEAKYGRAIELATVEGASRTLLLRTLLGAARSDFLLLGFFVFVLSFTAFSVPLVVGAQSGETVEVLMYRALFAQGNMGYALGLALVQIGILALISFVLRSSAPSSDPTPRNTHVLHSRLGLAFVVGFTSLLVAASFDGVGKGLREIFANVLLQDRLVRALFGSVLECLVVGLLSLFALLILSWRSQSYWSNRFVRGYVAPSVVLTALAYDLFLDWTSRAAGEIVVWVALGFASLIFPGLYRWRGVQTLAEVESQLETSRVLGASSWMRFRWITLPQVWKEWCYLAGIGALWASGDFAFASLVAGRELTLAVSAQGLLGGYRLEVATAVTWFSLVVGFVTFSVFERLGQIGFRRDLAVITWREGELR